ncbi:MAG TPA: hypothetical protein DEP07_16145 [Brevibacillus sp.]|jgi:hypothetical protein|nr:hypothetical protein [Brevibacillus sp.]
MTQIPPFIVPFKLQAGAVTALFSEKEKRLLFLAKPPDARLFHDLAHTYEQRGIGCFPQQKAQTEPEPVLFSACA